MKKKISVCLPCHNEEKYLPFSLPAIAKAPIDELIILLDRCTDNSERIIKTFSFPFKVKILEKQKQSWRCPTAEVFELTFKESEGDYIYCLACDIVADTKMFNPSLFKNADIISFFYYNYDLQGYRIHQHYLNFLKRYINFAKLWKGQLAWKSGLFACKRIVWEKTRFHDVPSEYDDFLERALRKGFKYRFIRDCKALHLRVGLSKSRQYLQGMSRAQRNVDPIMVVGHSLLCLKPYVLVSYLYEKRYRLFEKRKWSKEGYVKRNNKTVETV